MKKYKVTFLLDKNNNWIKDDVKVFIKSNKRFFFKLEENYKKIKNQDLVFILNYTKILPKQFLKKNHLNLVVHCSGLPKGKGFAPIQWQVLNNKNKIPICLIEADEKVDSGSIIEKTYFSLQGHELNNEIREIQSEETFKIIKKFLRKYPKLKRKTQTGKSSFYQRRYPSDSEININLNLKKIFNLLRVVDNENYPGFFIYIKKKYILKIYKVKT